MMMMNKQLPISEIVDAFGSDECTIQCRRHIRNLSRKINPFLDQVRVIGSSNLEPCAEIIALWTLRWQYNIEEAIDNRHRLRSILALATIKMKGNVINEKTLETITPFDVERAKAVSIENLYGFEKIKKISGRLRACCPFHTERSGSFFIFKDNKYRCFGCGEHGDAIDFYMKINGVEFIDAVKQMKGII